ncbi:hypothetical protein RhiirC2_862849 [Rhizophagus irregularis]|uniref:RRM domain-containing protein n=1 Tax=Rhizophagus irregularis TaxID=588596 RepID=A0A2N1NQ81_9GLOM|nr:hypothetical protein RhiirC2_862849 [Rhizophagus irregularis]
MGFKVSNIQTEATVDGIKGFFATHGSVYRVEIVTREAYDSENPERSTGTAYIIFKPVPAYPFWNKSLRFHGRVLQVDYQKYIRSSDTFYSYPAESLELGDYLLPENKYSAKCWVLHKCQKSKDKFNWCIDDFWKRITKDDKMPHFHKNNEQPGKWLVFRITFDLDQIGGLNRFKKLIEKAGEYNLAPRTSSISNFH